MSPNENPAESKVAVNNIYQELKHNLESMGYVVSEYGAMCFLFEYERYFTTK